MKIVGHGLGSVVVLFPPEEIRPTRGLPITTVIYSIGDRYAFLQVPDLAKPISELDQEGYKFTDGTFVCGNENFTINEFTVYNDGISITSWNTDTSELFFEDLMSWAREELEFRPFVREPMKIYRSHITVRFDQPLSQMIKGFDKLSNALSTALEIHTEFSMPVDLIRIGMGVDQSKVGNLSPVPFSLERRIGISFEEEWYFSEAPFPSKTHIKLLEELESAILTE